MQLALVIAVDGLVYAAWLFTVALGMTLVFGVMRVLNVAHGAFYALGAYVCATLLGWIAARGGPEWQMFLAIPLAAVSVGVVLGLVIEVGLLRLLQGRDEVAIVLATFALFLILEDAVLLVWGADAQPAWQIYGLLGTVEVGGTAFNAYDLSFVLVAAVLCLATWWGLKRTRAGRLLAIVIHDPEAARAFGVNTRRVFPVVFVIGCSLGALGGAYSAPMISVAPGIGVNVIVLAFAVVVIGGLGSIPGALAGALAVGLVRAAVVHLAPSLELFAIYAVMTLVLLVRPDGLFAPLAARRI